MKISYSSGIPRKRDQRAAILHANIKKEPRGGALGSGGGSEEGLGEELPQMGEGQREGNKSFRPNQY
jgi:hypothetical protein